MTDRGLTLIELTAALAIFALVGVMGLQALGGTILIRDRLTDRADATWQVAGALALLRADLEAAAPLVFVTPAGDRAPAFAPLDGGFAVSRAGGAVLPGTQETGLGRAEWRLDRGTGELRRSAWPTLTPLSTRARGPETVVLAGVEALDLRTLGGDGWRQATPGDSPTALPAAIEVSLRTRDWGDLRVVAAR